MNKPTTKKPHPAQRRSHSKPSRSRGKAGGESQRHSDDIERAVYDGMQDLRVKKPAGR